MNLVTWEELFQAPETVPKWFLEMVQSIKVADHLGDVWSALIAYAPAEAKQWIETVALAEYDEDADKYDTDV